MRSGQFFMLEATDVQITGAAGQFFTLEATDGFAPVNWQPLATNVLGRSSFNYADLDATKLPRRFYRALGQ